MVNKSDPISPYKALILAGGAGTRLWPVSRNSRPKQLLSLDGKLSLLQATYQRLRPIFKDNDIWIATATGLAKTIRQHLPGIKNFSLEPVAKSTAPAVGLAALKIWHDDPASIIVTVNSDHYIKNDKEYRRLLKLGNKIVARYPDQVLLIGLKTSYPETGYGYIKTGKVVENFGKEELREVRQFIEKPNLAEAKKYHAGSNYLWNPAIFIFRAQHMLNLFKKFLPRHHRLLMEISSQLKNIRRVEKIFKKMAAISIDYGIMEKSKRLLVLPSSFSWSDIGSWRAVYEILAANQGNVVIGKHLGVDSHGNLVYSTTDRLITTVDIEDSIIVDTEDALLIGRRDKSQNVRKIVDSLKQKGWDNYL